MNKHIKLAAGIVALAVSGLASAQFGGLSKLGGGGDSSVAPEKIVAEYVAGDRSVLSAQGNMLTAVGLKDEGAKAALEAKNLTDGATKDNLEEAGKIQTDSSKALQDKMNDKKVVMDASAKQQFGQGLLDLSKGIILYAAMKKDVSGFKPGVTSLGASTLAAGYVVKSLPGSMVNLGTTLKAAVTFAQNNNIPVPKEASDATALL
ncbi:MAG TPA: hypothetical protein VF472_11050 [Burkholderiaceae bacterium]